MTSRPRTSDLSDDLLADLRQVTPPPATRPPSAAASVDAPAAADPASPSLDVGVRISRQPWSALRVETTPGVSGIVLSGGPLRLRLGLSRG